MDTSTRERIDWHKRDTCSVCGYNLRNAAVHLASLEEKDATKHYFYSIEAKERKEGK